MRPSESAGHGVVARIIAFSAANPALILLVVFISAFVGVWSMRHTPLDAVPDLSDTQVVVLTDWPGQSPDLVEDQVTYPISSALLSTPGVRFVRASPSLVCRSCT